MSSGVYLALMLGVIGVLTALLVPALFWTKCRACGVRNALDAKECKRCGKAMPEE